MAGDYKPRKKRKQKKSLPPWLWLLAGLAIGLFVAALVYLDKQPASQAPFRQAVKNELEKWKKPAGSPARPPATPPQKEPKYNFYTLLEGMEVLIPDSETRTPDKAADDSEAAQTPHRYMLQIGAFQHLDDAERLKARLALLGVEADIQHVTVGRQDWHRVRTGPYQNRRQLQHDQLVLQNNRINALLIELK